MKRKDGDGIVDELAALAKQESEIRLKMAALREKRRRRDKQNEEREASIIGAAVVKAAKSSPEFWRTVTQVALVNVSDERDREFLAERGWEV